MNVTCTENERLQASAKLWLARSYTNDLVEFAAGDVNRFGRMVDGKGVSVASPAMWLGKIARISADAVVTAFFADRMNECIARLKAAGFQLPTQLN